MSYVSLPEGWKFDERGADTANKGSSSSEPRKFAP